MRRKKRLVALFAHPDDEAFGPGGTIAKLARTYDIYVLCATKGEMGKDSRKESSTSLGTVRAQELRRSSKVLGVKDVFFLGYKDGALSNNLYHSIAAKIEKHLKSLKPEIVLTSEPRGVSGHIDHITVSMVSSFVYERLSFVRAILYYCITKERALANKEYFIYVPPGYQKNEIDITVNISDIWNTKVQAMMEHQSQAHDVSRILKRVKKFPREEYFLVSVKTDKKKWIKNFNTILNGKKR